MNAPAQPVSAPEPLLEAALHPGRLFHIGIVTDDIDATLAEMSRDLGLTWRGGQPRTSTLWIYGEPRSVEMRIAHSVQGPPHYEVIAAVSGTPWQTGRGGAHHVCYWSDAPAAICARLEAAPGFRRVLGEPGAASGYFLAPSGLLIEIIGRELHETLSSWIAGAERR